MCANSEDSCEMLSGVNNCLAVERIVGTELFTETPTSLKDSDLTNIYSTAKETRKYVIFKLFEYLIISIPEFWFTYEVNRYEINVFSNEFRLLSIYGGLEWTLSSAAGTIKFWKASETDRIFNGFRITCLMWLIKCQWIWILPQMMQNQSAVTENAVLLYTDRKSAKLTNRYGIWPRLLRPLILQNHSYEHGSFNGKFWHKS